MQEYDTWRAFLGTHIQKPLDRRRIASELGVASVTLARWVEKKATPRPESLRRLLELFPLQHELFLSLIVQEFPGFSLAFSAEEGTQGEISSAFYRHVLDLLSSLPQQQIVSSCCRLILNHALDQLDPHHQHIALFITQCVPPSAGNYIRSLRSIMGVGTSPWGGNVERQSLFLGADTVPGRVASSGRPLTIDNYQEPRQFGPESVVGAISSCTYPLTHATNIAGTFGAISTVPEYFDASRQKLIQEYTKLASIVFTPDVFYSLERFDLRVMPPPRVQLPYIATLQQRIRQEIAESMKNKNDITYLQAEQLVWQQLEEELVHVAFLQD